MKRPFGGEPIPADVLWPVIHLHARGLNWGDANHALAALFLGCAAHKQNVHLRIVSERASMAKRIEHAFHDIVYVPHAGIRHVQVNGHRQARCAKPAVPRCPERHKRCHAERFGFVSEVAAFPCRAPIVIDAWRVGQRNREVHGKSLSEGLRFVHNTSTASRRAHEKETQV